MNNPTIEPTGFVYLITCESTTRVKIGFSRVPDRRLQELSTSAPGQLRIYRQWPGTCQDESKIHERLKVYRRHLEWFDIAPEDAAKAIESIMSEPVIQLNSMNDLYSIELSQVFAQAVEAGILPAPVEQNKNLWAFRIEFCPQHRTVLLPTCFWCGQE